MKKIKISRSFVPSIFTALNMVFGFLCIIFASRGEFLTASYFIIFAAISDSLDGIVARLTKSASKFGVELDSLADVVSFGVAPSALLYFFYFYSLDTWGVIFSVLPMLFTAMRLARFNTQLVGFDKEYFLGLPCPSAAITISSFIMFFFYSQSAITMPKDSLIFLSITISLLMVSTIKYDTLPKFNKKDIRRKPIKISIFLFGLILMIVFGGNAVFPFFIFYILTGIVRSLIKFIYHTLRKSQNQDKKFKLLDEKNV